MASFFGFGAPADIEVRLDGEEERTGVEVKVARDRRERCPVYVDGESVRGVVILRAKDGKKLAHEGVKIEFIGSLELFYDRGNHYEFISLVQQLSGAGEVKPSAPQTLPFEFKQVEKPFESYNGINVKLRYFIRVTLSRRMNDVVQDKELWVHQFLVPPESNAPIKMEVGIEDCLHIEFEYNKSKYHLKDVIVGKIYFLLVRIKIKNMELSIIRRETTGTGTCLPHLCVVYLLSY